MTTPRVINIKTIRGTITATTGKLAESSTTEGEGVDFPIDAADGNTVGYTVDAFGVKFVAFVAAVLDEFHGYEVAVVVSPVVVFDVPVVAVSVLRVVVEYEIADTVLDPLK